MLTPDCDVVFLLTTGDVLWAEQQGAFERFIRAGGGRAIYTALGHLPATWRDAAYAHHVYGGIYRAAIGGTFRAE